MLSGIFRVIFAFAVFARISMTTGLLFAQVARVFVRAYAVVLAFFVYLTRGLVFAHIFAASVDLSYMH